MWASKEDRNVHRDGGESSVAGSEKLICVEFDDSAVQSTSMLSTDATL